MLIRYKASDYTNIFKHTALGISIKVWRQILSRHRYNVELPFLFKAFFITLIAAANFPFQLVEHWIYDKKIRNTKVQDPIFILGHPRSGTTFLHYLLSADLNLAFCSTTDALTPNIMLTAGQFMEKILGVFMPSTRPQDNVKAGAKKPKEEEFAMANTSLHSFIHGFFFPKDLSSNFKNCVTFDGVDNKTRDEWKRDFRYLIQKLTSKNKGKRLVLKSPANTGRLKELHELYPDAVFIHIHRNPYEVFQSTRKLFQSVLPLLSFHKTDQASLDEFILNSYEWMHTKYLEEKNAVPEGQLYELSYSEFIKDPESHLSNMYSKLGIGDYEAVKENLSKAMSEFDNYQVNTHLKLEGDEVEQINSRWRFFFEEYGYEMKSLDS